MSKPEGLPGDPDIAQQRSNCLPPMPQQPGRQPQSGQIPDLQSRRIVKPDPQLKNVKRELGARMNSWGRRDLSHQALCMTSGTREKSEQWSNCLGRGQAPWPS